MQTTLRVRLLLNIAQNRVATIHGLPSDVHELTPDNLLNLAEALRSIAHNLAEPLNPRGRNTYEYTV